MLGEPSQWKNGREIRPLDLRHSCSERHTGQFFLDTVLFGLIGRDSQTVRKLEKAVLLSFLGLEPSLDKVLYDLIGTSVLASCKRLNLAIYVRAQRDAPTRRFF